MNINYRKLSVFNKGAILGLAFLVFSTYYYYYILGFVQDENQSNAIAQISKLLSLILFIIAFFRFDSIGGKFKSLHLIFVFFLGASLLFFLSKLIFIKSGNVFFLNTVIAFLPFFFFVPVNDRRRIDYFMKLGARILLLQIFLDIFIYFQGLSLWENKAFIGGLGNPSSFGIVCNIFLAYKLFLVKNKTRWIYIIFLPFAIVMTNSLFSIICLILLIMYSSWKKNKFIFVVLFAIGFIVLIQFKELILSKHALYKIESLIAFFLGGNSDSASVGQRVEIHINYFANLKESPLIVGLIGAQNCFYCPYDSQFLTYAESFGLFITSVFIIFSFGCIYLARNAAYDERTFYTFVFSMFFLFYFVNRILDYHPIPFILGLMLLMLMQANKKGRVI